MTKPKEQTKKIVEKITVSQTNRSTLDIKKLRDALRSAESVAQPRRAALYDLYAEYLLDGHLTAVIEKRKLSVTNTPIVFTENGEVNEVITQLTATEEFIELVHHVIDSKFFGHSLIELKFEENKLTPTLINRKHVEPKAGIILKNQYDISGFSYRELPYANYVLEVGNPDDLGLYLKAGIMVTFKLNGFSDFSNYSETYGSPFRICRTNLSDDTNRSLLEGALKNAGNASYIIVPEGVDFQYIESKAQASGNLYEGLITMCNKEISKLILGQTLTTEAGGSMAQAMVHQQVEHEILVADKLFVKNVLNDKLLPLLKIHGYSVGNGCFQFMENEHIDLQTRLDMDLKLSEKIKIDDAYFYKTYGLPQPKIT